MSSDSNLVHTYFAKLGFEPEIADIYLALQAYGPQSVMQLARNAKVERTRLYRVIDLLAEANLVEIEVHYKRRIYKAAPIANVQILLSKREQELKDLQDGFENLQRHVEHTSLDSPSTRVQFYKGSDGLKQMFWNETKSRTENLSILFENMQSKTNMAFFERWTARCNEQGIDFRSLVGDHFIQTQKDWYAVHSNEKLQRWEGRYVPGNVFQITHSTVTYNDVVAYYNWRDGEIFGVEIYNQEIADAQRQVFEMLWKQGTPLSDHGLTNDQNLH